MWMRSLNNSMVCFTLGINHTGALLNKKAGVPAFILSMKNESIQNLLIKGLWRLTGLRSSEFIRLVRAENPSLTGSRLRGVMSGVANPNFRHATNDDLQLVVSSVCVWAGLDAETAKLLTDAEMGQLLIEIDKTNAGDVEPGIAAVLSLLRKN